MNLKSIFRSPEGGVMAGLATAAAVYAIYGAALPPQADLRAGPPNDNDIESVRKGAAYKSAAVIGVVFLITRDLNTFILSGTSLVGIDYLSKHHNAYNSSTGKLEGNDNSASVMQSASVYSLPDYSESTGG